MAVTFEAGIVFLWSARMLTEAAWRVIWGGGPIAPTKGPILRNLFQDLILLPQSSNALHVTPTDEFFKQDHLHPCRV